MIYTVNIGDSSRRLWKRGYSRLVWIKITYAEAVQEVVDVLEMTGFIKMLHCVPTLADALKEFGE